MRRILAASRVTALIAITAGLVGCFGMGDSRIEILGPADGTTITTNDPIVVSARGYDIKYGFVNLYVSGSSVSATDTFKNPCDPCNFSVSFTPTAAPNGTHEVRVEIEEDLSTIAEDTVTLVLDRPTP